MKHAIEKSIERMRVELTVYDLIEIRRVIATAEGKKAFWAKPGNTDTTGKWVVEYKGDWIYVVYDSASRKVVTTLNKPEAWRVAAAILNYAEFKGVG